MQDYLVHLRVHDRISAAGEKLLSNPDPITEKTYTDNNIINKIP